MRGLQDMPLRSTYYAAIYKEGTSLSRDVLLQCLRNTDVDKKSGLPQGAASLALRYILPVYDLEQNVPPDTSQLQDVANKVLSGDARYAVHVTGSSIERLDVPPFTARSSAGRSVGTDAAPASSPQRRDDADSEDGCADAEDSAPAAATETSEPSATAVSHYTTADIDMMLEMKMFPVGVQQGTSLLYMEEASASHLGYTRVRVHSRPQDFSGCTELARLIARSVEADDGSVASYISVDDFNDSTVQEVQRRMADIVVNRQGPAINVQQEQQKSCDFPHQCVHDVDFVPALPLSEQLPAIAVWLERVSADKVKWPSIETQEEVRENGRCFLVGAGHASSERRDLEWRLSFSDPERRLAVSLTPNQRKVYKTVKLLQKCFLCEPKVLVTYHLKTLLFWELETCGVADWAEENLFQHTVNMLDRIEHCLEHHNIPSYFLPQNNLISHVSTVHVAQALTTVRQIRRHPLQHIYGIDQRLRFDFSSPEPLWHLHQPLRDAVLAGDVAAVPEALALSLLRQVASDVHRGVTVTPRCQDLLHDAWQALQPAAGGPHPVHDDWILFAASAAFSSMECDESAWVLTSLQIALNNEKRDQPQTKQLTSLEKEVLPVLTDSTVLSEQGATGDSMSSLLSGMLETAQQSGVMLQPPTESLLLAFRQAQLELLQDLKNQQQDFSGSPPTLVAVRHAKMYLSMIELLRKRRIRSGVSEPEAAMEAMMRVLKKLPELSSPTQSSTPMDIAMEGLQEIFGIPSTLLPHITPALMEELASVTSELNQSLKPTEQQPQNWSFQDDPRLIGILPMNMALTYIHLLGPGITEEEADIRFTPFFNMIGFFLKHRWYKPACRMVARMTCCGLVVTEMEQQRVVYDLRRAPLYLHSLPAPVKSLLELVSCRACIGVIYHFISFVNMLYDRELVTSLVHSNDLQEL